MLSSLPAEKHPLRRFEHYSRGQYCYGKLTYSTTTYVHYTTVKYCSVLSSAVQFCTVLYCTVQLLLPAEEKALKHNPLQSIWCPEDAHIPATKGTCQDKGEGIEQRDKQAIALHRALPSACPLFGKDYCTRTTLY